MLPLGAPTLSRGEALELLEHFDAAPYKRGELETQGEMR